MKTETEIQAEIKGLTRDEVEKRIETLKVVANRIATSDSRFAFMADDTLYEISVLEGFLKRKGW